MNQKIPNHLYKAGNEVDAAQLEFDASIQLFEAAAIRQDPGHMKAAEQAAHGALQRLLDSKVDMRASMMRHLQK